MALLDASSSSGLDLSEASSSRGMELSGDSSSNSSGLAISGDSSSSVVNEFPDVELVEEWQVVEEWPQDLRRLVKARKRSWRKWYKVGLCLHTEDDSEEEDPSEWEFTKIQDPPQGYWPSLFEAGERNCNLKKEIVKWVVHPLEGDLVSVSLMERAGGFLPGLPDEIVENHIWPRLQTQFRGLTKYSLAEKGEILETFRALRCVSPRWNHLVTFSYEWAVYRMVQWDFIQGWVWWSHMTARFGPLREISRMLDLLPEATEDATPYLHHKMGFLKTEDLWIWRSYLNFNRHLRYTSVHVHCGILGDLENTRDFDDCFDEAIPCTDCIYYPRRG